MATSITTRSYDTARTGATDSETVLSATAVRARGIAKLFSMAIPDDPRLEAQPLAIGGVRLANGQTHDMIIQASMGNTVYAFDATSGAPLWKTNLGRPIAGTRSIDAWLINVSWGILSTPVVDEAAGVLYACAWISPDGSAPKGQHYLAAVRLNDGALARPLLNLEGAVYAPPKLPEQRFVSAQRKQRAALTLLRGHVLIPFGTISETATTARGWLIGVDVARWRIAATWCSTVTGYGGGIWQSGSGPALGADGSIFVVTGNGSFNPQKGDYGECVVKLALRTGAGTGATAGAATSLNVVSWWAPWTDVQRGGGAAEAETESDGPQPSNVVKTRLFGHARRMGLAMPHLAETNPLASGHDRSDPHLAALVSDHMGSMMGSVWTDQDFGAGGPVFAQSAGVILAAGKDGVLYTTDATQLGDTQLLDLTPAANAANYGKLRAPPILYTYYDPTVTPAPQSPTALNLFPGSATRHLHGTPLLWQSTQHGWMHFVGGENSPLRAWSLAANGSSTYLAGSNEIASAQSPRPPGGMPGWSITLAGNNGADAIVVAMIPYTDANMGLSAGRFLVYDAQNFVKNPDGSSGLQVLWDSEAWGPDHAFTHPKFNRPIVWRGRIYRPTYDGRIDVYGIPGQAGG